MRKLPPIVPVRSIPEQFENYLSPIEWLAKLTKAYNEISGDVWEIDYDEDTCILTIKEKEMETNG